jgi:hypothetical protein
MFKINIEDEKILLEYLNSKDNLYRRREKILNELLEIEEKNNNFWELDSLYGQLFHNKYDSMTSLSNVSHLLKTVEKINGEYFGYIKVLTTNCGKILDGLIKQGSILYLEPVYYSIYIDKKIIRLDIK